MYSGSIFVLSEGEILIIVPGKTVRMTPSGTRISSEMETSPDHTVSEVRTAPAAAEGA
jgi:hypothetical protein